MRWRRRLRKETYREDGKATVVARGDGAGGTDWIAMLGGTNYAYQAQHPDGGWLRIAWDGTITTANVNPPDAGP